ncbi:glycosyltransferase family 2 protein [Tortispora caseinolytica NRRL Y-17796]|uniref:dolichyl-phosphate beta-glucosyltransferase n=1 Tax=Tortispora caseinolytica NRRL Y-17796 TaxID=767744 RepID=A0A1E4TEB1_9ASCO|nr:glycosyltransferase family 2 protein [Tortispora caseinolytica NRRL Y-17796]
MLSLISLLILLLAAILALYILVLILAHRPAPYSEEEQRYRTYTTALKPAKDLPRAPELFDPASIELSLVIPCYNEQDRLPPMLDEALPVLIDTFGSSWEILIIDDDSQDSTVKIALDWAKQHIIDPEMFRIIHLNKNRGKGGAVIHGMHCTRGSRAIFADADGASKFSDLLKLLKALQDQGNSGIAIGSRAHLVKSEAVVKRSWIRNLLMYGLHTLLYVFGIRHIADTQCGFKLFSRDAAQKIFPAMHIERWIFDVEILILAQRLELPAVEVPISWHEVPGSKIDLARDSIQMAADLVLIRLAYAFGIYRDDAAISIAKRK